MRVGSVALGVLAAALFSGAVSARPLRTGCEVRPPAFDADPAHAGPALKLLQSLTQLRSQLGMQVLTSNLDVTVAVNNQASPPLRARAIVDSLITDENATILADGLGETMGGIYRAKAPFWSRDDGVSWHCGEIGTAVTDLISVADGLSGGDSNAGKFGYVVPGRGFEPPPGGIFDVLGIAYGRRAGAIGADAYGNSRPFQTAPLDAATGPAIRSYEGVDFFNVPLSSRILLMGGSEADKGLRNGSDLTNNPSYPSGHTTFGYTEALVLALLVPERYRALAYRGSEYGHSRIVLGAHYAVDVIAGRTLATYDLAQNLAGTQGYKPIKGGSFRAGVAAAARELRAYLQTHGCPDIAACAARDPIVRAENASMQVAGKTRFVSTSDAYAFRLHYGLAPMAAVDRPPEPVPPEAATLLETRFPYLTTAQRLDILRATEGPSGHFLDVSPIDGVPLAIRGQKAETQAGSYSRLNLFAAAGGFTRFDGQVEVNQDAAAITDPDLAPFLDLARADTWTNDIGGSGGLIKRGAGVLTLAGANTYAGPTLVSGGMLEVTGAIVSPARVEAGATLAGTGKTGDVLVAQGGILAPGALYTAAPLSIWGGLTLESGATYRMRAETGPTQVAGVAKIGGAHVVVPAGGKPGDCVVLTAQGGIEGSLADVVVEGGGLSGKATVKGNQLVVTLEATR